MPTLSVTQGRLKLDVYYPSEPKDGIYKARSGSTWELGYRSGLSPYHY